jgi:hypothetical protein
MTENEQKGFIAAEGSATGTLRKYGARTDLGKRSCAAVASAWQTLPCIDLALNLRNSHYVQRKGQPPNWGTQSHGAHGLAELPNDLGTTFIMGNG